MLGRGVTWMVGVVAAMGASGISGQETTREAVVTADDLRVEVLTADPGDLIWERFGHNALRIVDEASGLDVAWNWGVFDFRQEDFIPRLVRGTMLYQMAPYSTEAFLREYVAAGRAVWSQELDLTPSERQLIQQAVIENYRPENRFYRYDYYRDNCSTRIRDILDRALGGRIRAETGDVVTGTTYRWHTRRLLRDVFWAYAGIQLVLGNRADEPITAWQEMFVPMRLRDYLSRATVEREGVNVPLVREARLLVPSNRGPVPEAPPRRFPVFLLVGVAWGGAILLAAKGAVAGHGRARLRMESLGRDRRSGPGLGLGAHRPRVLGVEREPSPGGSVVAPDASGDDRSVLPASFAGLGDNARRVRGGALAGRTGRPGSPRVRSGERRGARRERPGQLGRGCRRAGSGAGRGRRRKDPLARDLSR